mmetsp:Transcript_1380/g.8537  ORF Transcript_1380/g.8537 Transcript_1380/m.8537 type:complete len:311 (+) Transcript_1380:141-1073(+)
MAVSSTAHDHPKHTSMGDCPPKVAKTKDSSLVLRILGASVLVAGIIVATTWSLPKVQLWRKVDLLQNEGNWYEEIRHVHKNSSIAVTTTITTNYFYIPFSIRWEQYACKMRYDWYQIDLDRTNLQFPAAHWHKISVIYALLLKGYEYVLFTDGDTVLMHPEIRIEEFIREAPQDTQLWISEDLPGVQTIINTGLMIVRNGTWSIQMLKYVMHESRDQRVYPHHWPAEQGSVHRWIQVHPKPFFHMYPYGERFQVFSSFSGNPAEEAEDKLRKGIWVLHFPGGYSESRHQYARSLFDYMQGKHPIRSNLTS